ncbi:unnamed protein product [Ceutorhynchus assimilis]|uniref:Uncharacterized protein n=1 Tax=Ceutorhynchus assimilis TaxID=467358 RepID=A0A9P0DHR2_9CUCU|nr:unnamed protein product [Ceutorhynchus assimilis]
MSKLIIVQSGKNRNVIKQIIRFPYKYQYYKTALFFQFLHIALATIYNVSVQPLVLSVMIFLKAKLRILQYRIRNIEQVVDKTLKQLIKEHQELIQLHGEFNASFQYIVLTEYCATFLTLALSFIELLQAQRILFHLFFSGYVSIQLFTIVWNANEILLENSVGLAKALYDSPWYKMDKTSKILIHIMLMRCIKPLTIFIGPFGYMDFNAAVSRVKLAYSVVSVFSRNQ